MTLGSACGGAGPGDAQYDEETGEIESTLVTTTYRAVFQRSGSEDAQIDSGTPTANIGASQTATVSTDQVQQRHWLHQFDLSAIPQSTKVTSAILTLNVQSSDPGVMSVHRIAAPWTESTVTWSSFGGAYSPTKEVQTAVPSSGPLEINVHGLVEPWVKGTYGNYGILLERQTPGSTVFASGKAVTSPRPRLDVEYGDYHLIIQRATAQDALINSGTGSDGSENKNYGQSGSLTASVDATGWRNGLLKFDLSIIPPNAIITSAVLKLNVLLANVPAPVRVHRITVPWDEQRVTWASFGGAYSPTVETVLPATSQTAAPLEGLVQQWVAGVHPNYGIVLERGLAGMTVFASSDVPWPSLRPRLEVEWHIP